MILHEINWVDWTIDEFQVFVCYMSIRRCVWCFVFLELCCISDLTYCILECLNWLHEFELSVEFSCFEYGAIYDPLVYIYTITCIDRSVRMYISINILWGGWNNRCEPFSFALAQDDKNDQRNEWQIDKRLSELFSPPSRPNFFVYPPEV